MITFHVGYNSKMARFTMSDSVDGLPCEITDYLGEREMPDIESLMACKEILEHGDYGDYSVCLNFSNFFYETGGEMNDI